MNLAAQVIDGQGTIIQRYFHFHQNFCKKSGLERNSQGSNNHQENSNSVDKTGLSFKYALILLQNDSLLTPFVSHK